MNKIILGAVALAGVAMSVPANAQGVYFDFGGPGYARTYDGYRPYGYGDRYYYGGYRRHFYRSYASNYGGAG